MYPAAPLPSAAAAFRRWNRSQELCSERTVFAKHRCRWLCRL